jgi:hypothetical protein
VKESYSPVLLRRRAIETRRATGDHRWKAPIEMGENTVVKTILWSCIRPFQLLFFEQMVLCLNLLSSILLGIIYLFFGVRTSIDSSCETPLTSSQAFAIIFPDLYGFNLWQTGLTFLSIFVGMVFGTCCDPLWRRNCTCNDTFHLQRRLLSRGRPQTR